jgi:hypothetical protein
MGFFKPLQRWRTSNFREKAQTAKAGRYGVVPTFFANFDIVYRYEAAIQK